MSVGAETPLLHLKETGATAYLPGTWAHPSTANPCPPGMGYGSAAETDSAKENHPPT